MNENKDSSGSNHEEGMHNSVAEYLERAMAACAEGDAMLGMHLYLAAFEEDISTGSLKPSESTILGLKKAWALACTQKERSLAEYIFEKMEPYLSAEEISICASEMQDLVLDKLEEFGLSRDDLEDMAEMISQDIVGMDSILQVEHIVGDPSKLEDVFMADVDPSVDELEATPVDEFDVEPVDASELIQDVEEQTLSIPEPSQSSDASADENSENVGDAKDMKSAENAEDIENAAGVRDVKNAEDTENAKDAKNTKGTENAKDTEDTENKDMVKTSTCFAGTVKTANIPKRGAGKSNSKKKKTVESSSTSLSPSGMLKSQSTPNNKSSIKLPENPMEALTRAVGGAGNRMHGSIEQLDYDNLSGYDTVIDTMHEIGIGLRGDESFRKFVKMLNAEHGLDSPPALDTLLFRAPAREDANRFVMATLGELKLPVLRMNMEDNFQGMPVLCVTAQAENMPKLNAMRTAFEGGGVLILEDIDTWGSPLAELGDDTGNFIMMQLSRGAREAVSLIRSAVENPEVYVFATTSTLVDPDPFFLDILDPLSFVDIENPTLEERVDLWEDIVCEHPSLRNIDRGELVRLSANMPRFDIYMAAREAVEDAYKIGLMQRRYCPVTGENIFDKLAAYQPLESREYQELEEAVIRDFQTDLDHLDDLLDEN